MRRRVALEVRRKAMLLKGLSDEAFPQWLASIICCVPFRKPQEDERGDHHLEGEHRRDNGEA